MNKTGPGNPCTNTALLTRLRILIPKQMLPWRVLALVMALVMVFPLIAATPAEIAAMKAEIKSYQDAIEAAEPVIQKAAENRILDEKPKASAKSVETQAKHEASKEVKTLKTSLLGKNPKPKDIERVRDALTVLNVFNTVSKQFPDANVAAQVTASIVTTMREINVKTTPQTTPATAKYNVEYTQEILAAIVQVEEQVKLYPLDWLSIEANFHYLTDMGVQPMSAFGIILGAMGNGLVALQLATETVLAYMEIAAALLQPYLGVILICVVLAGVTYLLVSKAKEDNNNLSDAEIVEIMSHDRQGAEIIPYRSAKTRTKTATAQQT